MRGSTFRMFQVWETAPPLSAVIGNLCEFDSAIVTCLSNPRWAQAWVSAMLALQASFDCCYISHIACMWSAFSIFTLIVWKDKPLLAFLDKLPVCLEWGIQHCVTTEHCLCWRCPSCCMHGWVHSFPTCSQNALETKELIWVPFVPNLCATNHVVKCLVTSFNYWIRLRISAGNCLSDKTTFVPESVANFCSELWSLVHSNFRRPGMSREPMDFELVGCCVGSLLADVHCVKESCYRINHRHAVKFDMCFGLLLVPKLVRTYQVCTWCVPRNDFQSGLRWKQTMFLVSLLVCCTVGAVLACTNAGDTQTNPCMVLHDGEFWSLLTRVHQR